MSGRTRLRKAAGAWRVELGERSSAGSLRAGQRMERKVRVGIKVEPSQEVESPEPASPAWFASLVGVMAIYFWTGSRSRQGGFAVAASRLQWTLEQNLQSPGRW